MYIIYKLIISSNGLFYRVMKYFASGIATNITNIATNASSVSTNASDLYAKNMINFISYLTENNEFKWDLKDEITDETLIVKDGVIRKT